MSGLLVPVEGYTEIIEHDHPLTEEWITRVFAQHGSDGKLVAIELRDPLEVLTGNVVLTICEPSPPTIQPLMLSRKNTPKKKAVIGTLMSCQVVPPSVDR